MNFKKMILAAVAFFFIFSLFAQEIKAGMVSPGVHHSSSNPAVSGDLQRINQLTINMDTPYTTIDLGISNPYTALATVSNLSRSHSKAQNHVVGAINASLFTFENGLPTYLLADGNEIVNLGAVSTQYNDFMHTPAAFGVTADNKAKIGKYDLSYTISHNGKNEELTSLNRERQRGESILYTSSWPYPNTRTNSTGLEVVVTASSSVNTGYEFGEKVTGTVTAIRSYGQYTSATIPENGFVISAVDKAEVDKIRDMKIGDTVGLAVDVEPEWKGSQFMLATGPLLVQNGEVNLSIDLTSPRVKQQTARTAVAVNADGSKAYFVTVDSGRTGSAGMTLTDFAAYLKSIGAHNAINLDGGGSTTMVARKYGDVYPSLVNQPSAGTERKVSAILEAISTAPYGQATYVKASPNTSENIAVEEAAGFTVDSVLDQYYNTLPIDQSKLKLESVTNGVGKIENNQFIGVKAGTGTVNAKYENTAVSIPVTIVPKVSLEPYQMSSLDSLNGLSSDEIRAEAEISSEHTLRPKEGKGSVKLEYDFTAYKEGVSAAYLTWNSAHKIPGQPRKIGAWVYGDGMNHWLRGALIDANGKEIVVDFTTAGKLDWVGWNYVEAEIPAAAVAPLSFRKIYVAETKSTAKSKGAIWIDGLTAVYKTGEPTEKSYTASPDARLVDARKEFTVTFSQNMNAQFIHDKYVYVEDEMGVRQPVTVKKGSSPDKVTVSAPAGGYAKGKNYRLVVTHLVPNMSDITMTKDHITEFKIR